MKSLLCLPLGLAAAVFLANPAAAGAAIVNIDGTVYGFAFPTDPAPVVGQVITPITNPGGGPFNQLTLGAGTYRISNATGLAGANPAFTGWRFNGSPNWVWSVVVADDATDKVVFYGDAGGVQTSQALIAADPGVQNFSGTFTLPATTTLDFMIRDYYLPDNAGGVAVNVQFAPEPTTLVSLTVGAALLTLRNVRRKPTRA